MIKLLKIELLKLKNSSVFTIALTILAISVFTSIQLVLSVDSDIQVKELLGISMNMFGLFYYPIFIILFVSMMIRLDNVNNIWKIVLSSGANKINVYLSKYIFTLIVIAIFVFINILSIILASMIKFNMREIIFIGMKRCLYIILASAGFISIEFITALIFKSFLIPISVGVMGIFVTFITSMSGEYIIVNPFGYASNIAMGVMSEQNILLSIVLSILITILATFYIIKVISKRDN
ncbi:MAG: ABC transporter permease [Clostridium sp.]|uniref:ABC transporter permease n=1 Tax=Clostridium sp. TaxID=1506 RepID=UPI0025CD5BA9|nr:ABC transporter permease [Clostridium sp.]MDY2630767.1 ABC transporter permease [Clostridium sp.]